MRSLMGRRRLTMFYFSLTLALGLFGFGLFSEAPSASSVKINCGDQELAGRWINTAKPDGSDLQAAEIRIPCSNPAAAVGLTEPALTPKIELQLTMRCMHVLSCDWQTVPAAWSQPDHHGKTPVLSAHYDQDRFDRQVTIEPSDGGKLMLTLTSRLKGLGVAPLKTIYTLERPKA